MALTAQNRSDIRYYLGFSARFYFTDTVLESAMTSLESDAEAEVQVLADITRLKALDLLIEGTYTRLKATQVCDIKVAGKKEMCTLQGEGRRIVGRVASTIGVPPRHDVFSSGAYRGQQGYWGISGGGNYGIHG